MRTKKNKLMNREDRLAYRKKLRQSATTAEKALWNLLRTSRINTGLKFRRQHSIGCYIVDFYCPQINLAIELDGQVHVGNEEIDEQRTEYLKNIVGITVLRYENRFVFEHPDCILQDIDDYLRKGI